jgi:hypothetical protein
MRKIDYLRSCLSGMELRNAAVLAFTAPMDMSEFYAEYINYVRAWGKTEQEKEHPEKVARQNMLELLSYYGDDKILQWKRAVPALQTTLEKLIFLFEKSNMYRGNMPNYHSMHGPYM